MGLERGYPQRAYEVAAHHPAKIAAPAQEVALTVALGVICKQFGL